MKEKEGEIQRRSGACLHYPPCLESALAAAASPSCQGLTLIHISAQRKHFLWDKLGDFNLLESKTAQDELRSGRA